MDLHKFRSKVREAWEENDYVELQELFEEQNGLDDPILMLPGYKKENDHFFGIGIRTYGGGFVKKLLELYIQADTLNSPKIRKTWPEYYIQYVVMGKQKDQSKQK